jgi:hypothetical protein
MNAIVKAVLDLSKRGIFGSFWEPEAVISYRNDLD